ncbi:hypothetical protein QQS21_005392 [Conoideocrella luteorostrata]|uniref:Alpha/beta-hydrolase n=1 Tax=Conoideocrella luteorostrata TaxID=1105319 RepID=A0AAJ0CPP2_9HYPO|nr:hypothetical protein QQS21_005392 [Conoideocrella luteorostrata]
MKLSQLFLLAGCTSLAAVSDPKRHSPISPSDPRFDSHASSQASPRQAPRSLHSVSKRSNSTKDAMVKLSPDLDFHFEILRAMSLAPFEGSDIGEVLVAAQKIKPKDFESYYGAFNRLATRVHEAAKDIDSHKYPVSARNAFFKAATYYRSADFFLHGNWTDPRINTLWDSQLAAFDAALKLMPIPGQRVTLRAKDDNFTIPAIFFSSGRPGPRPTVIMCNGYDGSQEEMYHLVGQSVLQRGMNVISFEGPGQPTVRRQQNLGFITQWEKVVTPVVDFALTRPEVDPAAIGLLGYSFGGYLAPRAAAFEHRLAAVLAVDGLFSFGDTVMNQFKPLEGVFKSGNASFFNSAVEKALADPSADTQTRWAVQQGMWSFNAKTPFEWLTKTQAYTLVNVTQQIKAPVFVADADDDQFFMGQAPILADKLGKLATYHMFKAADGAGEHCSVGAAVLENQVMLDWFQNIVDKGQQRTGDQTTAAMPTVTTAGGAELGVMYSLLFGVLLYSIGSSMLLF